MRADGRDRQEYDRRYARENSARIVARVRAWRAAHPERTRRWARERARKVAPMRRAYFIAYRAANRMRTAEYVRRYRDQHKKEIAFRVARWARENVARRVQSSVRRRARKFGNGGSHTLAEWVDKCALLGNVCFYCGEAKPLTRDHKVPLTRGGSDDIENIIPACRSCNTRKGTLTAQEFLARKAA